MRLFIAINFDQAFKASLFEIQSRIRGLSPRGSFTREENFHVTLAFLGETPAEALPRIKAALSALAAPPFDILFSRLGCFKQSRRELWWIGVEEGSEGLAQLEQLRAKLVSGLAEQAVPFDPRGFKPHITLGREFQVREGPDLALKESLKVQVSRISLMKSERLQRVLTYTELFGQDLRNPAQ